jgi:hypothetical protein
LRNRVGPSEVIRLNPYKEVQWVNSGLMFGVQRANAVGRGGKDAKKADEDLQLFGAFGLSARHNQLYRSSPRPLWDSVNRWFLRRHAPMLKERASGIPWFLPEWLGGLGLVGTPSSSDLKFALAAYYHIGEWSKFPSALGETSQWRIRQAAEDQFSDLPEVLLTEEQYKLYSDAVGRASTAVLYDSALQLEDILVEDETSSSNSKGFAGQLRFLRYLGYRTEKPRFGYAPLRPAARVLRVEDSQEPVATKDSATLSYLYDAPRPLWGRRVHLRAPARFEPGLDLSPADEFLVLQGQSALAEQLAHTSQSMREVRERDEIDAFIANLVRGDDRPMWQKMSL